jgi:A/G-specific adenine glycosylase
VVMEAWDGLGYYARARNLHALAREVVRRYDATLPDDPEQLEELPGVGRYTAGAVACFAYEKPVPTVDTNVKRVLERVFEAKDVWKLAAAIVPKNGKRAWKFNQALMELGALTCVARRPRCPECPVKSDCLWFTNPGRKPGAFRNRSRPIASPSPQAKPAARRRRRA